MTPRARCAKIKQRENIYVYSSSYYNLSIIPGETMMMISEKKEEKIYMLAFLKRGTPAKICKFCVKQKCLSENDSENEIKIR